MLPRAKGRRQWTLEGRGLRAFMRDALFRPLTWNVSRTARDGSVRDKLDGPPISSMWLEIHHATTLRQTLFSTPESDKKKRDRLSPWHKQPMSPPCPRSSSCFFFSSPSRAKSETCGRQDMDHLAIKATGTLHASRDIAHSPLT